MIVSRGTVLTPNVVRLALLGNFFWINLSEIWRYFVVVKPMLEAAFPQSTNIAAVTPVIFLSWMVWDTVLIISATGFYLLYLEKFSPRLSHAVTAASAFTITVFGLLWLGVVNMGLVPHHFLWTTLPLAWVEQVVAALIVIWAMRLKDEYA